MTDENRKIQIQVWVDMDLYKWLNEHAEAWCVSRSVVVRWALLAYKTTKETLIGGGKPR